MISGSYTRAVQSSFSMGSNATEITPSSQPASISAWVSAVTTAERRSSLRGSAKYLMLTCGKAVLLRAGAKPVADHGHQLGDVRVLEHAVVVGGEVDDGRGGRGIAVAALDERVVVALRLEDGDGCGDGPFGQLVEGV